ncbi:MAG: DUF922 domain-containing protein [Bacteroidia bacterium]|nr:DUF922 domain-containing protein [Bacteroidia bacterium]
MHEICTKKSCEDHKTQNSFPLKKFYLFSVLIILFLSFSIKKNKDEIKWEKDLKIKWENFRGTPNSYNSFYANTNSGMSFLKFGDEDSAYFTVTAVFYAKKSWVRLKFAQDTLLKHEQLHFDISELFARKFRERLFQLNKTKTTYNEDFDKIRNDIVAGHDAYQDKYDQETEHCMNVLKQAEWSEKITSEIAALDKFSAEDVRIACKR